MRKAMVAFLSAVTVSVAGCGGGGRTPGATASPAASPPQTPVGTPGTRVGAALGASPGAGATATAARQHDIRGRIEANPRERWTVRLDHDEVPGVMAAMTNMEYGVADPAILEGLAAGDLVEGHLEARSGGYVIVALRKR